MAEPGVTDRRASRSMWGTLALTATAVSIVAFVGLMIGAAAGLQGFEEGEEATVLGAVAWFGFTLGAIVALVVGLIALLRGRHAGRAGDRRAGRAGIGWFVLAVLAIVVISALD